VCIKIRSRCNVSSVCNCRRTLASGVSCQFSCRISAMLAVSSVVMCCNLLTDFCVFLQWLSLCAVSTDSARGIIVVDLISSDSE
jgi:hypothetical protein